LYVLDYNVLEC